MPVKLKRAYQGTTEEKNHTLVILLVFSTLLYFYAPVKEANTN